jgi:hypothetical protein
VWREHGALEFRECVADDVKMGKWTPFPRSVVEQLPKLKLLVTAGSRNLGIDFANLKASMTGLTLQGDKTNQPTKSLGQAIHQFKPGVDAEAEAAAATKQATREAGQ